MSAEILVEAEIDEINEDIKKLKEEKKGIEEKIERQSENTKIIPFEKRKISFFWVCSGIILIVIGFNGINRVQFDILISLIEKDYVIDSVTACLFLMMLGFACILWGFFEHLVFFSYQSTLEYYNEKSELRIITNKIKVKESVIAEKTLIIKTIVNEKEQAREHEISRNYDLAINIWNNLDEAKEADRVKILKAKERERALDYDSATHLWEELGNIEEAARIRKLQAEQGSVKVAQKVVQGDEVTEIKDSVLNRSNIGSGGKSSKAEALREAKSLFEEGLIDDDEFKQMKKEILEK